MGRVDEAHAEVEFLLAYFIIKGNACAVFIVIQI